MEKTESKTGGIAKFQEMSKDLENNPKILRKIIKNLSEKIDELQAKAAAYDRLMSGNPTPKEIANLLGMVIAQNPNNTWVAFNSMPNLSFFTRRWETVDKKKGLDITHCHIRYNDAWGNSLTLPDGWEEK